MFAKRDLEVRSGLDDVLGNDRVADVDGESLAQSRGFRACRVQPRELDRLEGVLTPRLDCENDLKCLLRGLDARVDGRIVIAARAEQLRQQVGIGPRPAIDLGGVGRLPPALAQRGLGVEGLGNRGLFIDALKALDDDRVAALFRGIDRDRLRQSFGSRIGGRRCIWRIHVGPVDAKVRQGRHRGGRIEFGRVGCLRECRCRDDRKRRGRARQAHDWPPLSPRLHRIEPNRRS